jgi:fructuronate reductase
MKDEALAHFVSHLMNMEVTSTFTVPPGTDVSAYKQALLSRFRNPGLRHRTWQIAMDGSQKLPQRLLGTIRDRLKAGALIDALALGVAAWMRYVTGTDERGQPIDVRDPLKDELRAKADAAGLSAERLAPALLEVREIFTAELAADPRFREAVTDALARIIAKGAKASVAELKG